MTRTLIIAIVALIGGWFSGDLAYSGGFGGQLLFLILAATWPCLIAVFASRNLIVLAPLPGIMMSIRISVINQLDPRFYNDLSENVIFTFVFAVFALAISLAVSVPLTVLRRPNQRLQLTDDARNGEW